MNSPLSFFYPRSFLSLILFFLTLLLISTSLVACSSTGEPLPAPTEPISTSGEADNQDAQIEVPNTLIPIPESSSTPNEADVTTPPTAIVELTETSPPAPVELTPIEPTPVESTPVEPTIEIVPTLLPTVTPVYPTAVPATEAPSETNNSGTVDPSLEQNIEAILASMSIEEKIGQLFLVYFVGPTLSDDLKQMINEYHVGGILFFRVSDNIQSLNQVANLIDQSQNEAITHGANIPLLVGIDHEGGSVMRLRNEATLFPSNMAVGATWDYNNASEMARVSAQELEALGINMNLAPVVDVNNNPANPVIGIRSFGSSPEQVAQFGQAMIMSYENNRIIATAKHFPGHGDTSIDSHFGLPIISHDEAHFEQIELRPFQEAINANISAIMTAHVLLPTYEPNSNLPATLSSNVLEGLLRQNMGFEGLIVTDSLGMGALTQQYTIDEAAVRAFQAGADVLAFGPDSQNGSMEQRLAYDKLLGLVQSGQIPIERLDQSVRRILLAKAKAGVLNWQPTQDKQLNALIRTEASTNVARRIAQESITLVKDNTNRVPILADQPVLVIWPAYTGDLASALRQYHTNVESLPVSLDPTAEEIQLAAQKAQTASQVIIVTVDTIYHPAQTQLVNTLSGHDPIVAAVGSPYDLMQIPTEISTYLATYGHIPASIDALAKVIAGVEQPKGRLPIDLPGFYALGDGIVR